MHVLSKCNYRNSLKYCTRVDRRYTDVATLSFFQFEFVGWRLNIHTMYHGNVVATQILRISIDREESNERKDS